MHAERRAGFTLVELLVVVAIISLLIAILLPALGRVRHQAELLTCATGVRQSVVAMLTYETDQRFLPWVEVRPGSRHNNEVRSHWKHSANPNSPMGGRLLVEGEYLSDDKVMRCPVRSDETPRYRGVTDYAFAYYHVYDSASPDLNPKPWTTSRVMRDKVIKSSYGSGPSARGSRVLLLDAYNPWAGGFPGPGGIPHGDPTCNVGLTDGAVQRFNVFGVEDEVIRNGGADHTARLYDLWGRGTLYLINREMGYLR